MKKVFEFLDELIMIFMFSLVIIFIFSFQRNEIDKYEKTKNYSFQLFSRDDQSKSLLNEKISYEFHERNLFDSFDKFKITLENKKKKNFFSVKPSYINIKNNEHLKYYLIDNDLNDMKYLGEIENNFGTCNIEIPEKYGSYSLEVFSGVHKIDQIKLEVDYKMKLPNLQESKEIFLKVSKSFF